MEKMRNIELIRKLRLKKGCEYILFLPKESVRIEEAEILMKLLKNKGWSDSLAILINDPAKIKVIEK